MIHDVAIIGGGVVGTAIARELSRYDCSCVLIEANSDVGAATSKGNSAILHTGFDAPPGSLESQLVQASYNAFGECVKSLGIAVERIGALLVAWTDDQIKALPGIIGKAQKNGVNDVAEVTLESLYEREPYLAKGAKAALEVPGESIIDPFTPVIAFATQAALNGVGFRFNSAVKNIRTCDESSYHIETASGTIQARYVINAAGLYSDDVDRMFGHDVFHVTPRKGEFVIYDKISRFLVNHILLPIPTEKTKGMLVTPTVFGNVLAGPTADDRDDKTDTCTTENGLQRIRENAERLIPELAHQPVTATYAGLRAATEHRDYQIYFHADRRYITVGGIRSTGLTGSLGIADYVVKGLIDMGMKTEMVRTYPELKPRNLGEVGVRPCQCEELIHANPDYGRIVCHCERVSRGEILDALSGTLPAHSVDSLRRRTRATMGRCQGFHCQAEVVSTIAESTGQRIDDVLNGGRGHD